MSESGYLTVKEAAERFGVSKSTIRRNIKEGRLFPEAKKVEKRFGEQWLIPRTNIEIVTLKDISPKGHQEKNNKQHEDEELLLAKIKSLEDRIVVLESLLGRYMAQKVNSL